MHANPLTDVSTRALRHRDLYAICSVTIFVSVAILLALVAVSGRPFTYPLDDTYIHLTIARTIAQTGVWGIGPMDPAAASSSPIYTLLLVLCYLLSGGASIFEYAPLALNIVAVAACCVIWIWALSDSGALAGDMLNVPSGSRTRLLSMLFLSASAPLFVLAFLGMEHTLDVAIASLAAWLGSRLVAQQGSTNARQSLILFSISFLAIGIRYENVLLIGPLTLVASLNGNWRHAFALTLGAALPILGFGLWWAMAGGWFLPNSILVKVFLNAAYTPQGKVARRTLECILFLHLALLVTHFWVTKKVELRQLLGNWRFVCSSCALTCGAAQILFGIVGWLYRYEAAALSINIFSILLLLIAYFGLKVRVATLLAIFAITAFRSCDAMRLVALAPNDRRWEHAATAQFINDAFSGKTVVVNDIGLAAWRAPQTRVLDVVGLASNEIAKRRIQHGGLKPEDVRDWADSRNAVAAFLQVCWLPVATVIPDDWSLVAVLSGPRNVVFGDKLVGMYATSQINADYLRGALAHFPSRPESRLYLLDEMTAERQEALNRQLRVLGGCRALDAVIGTDAPSGRQK